MGLFGPPNVEKLRSAGNIGGLIKALGYKKDRGVVEAASSALVELMPASIEPLIQSLDDKDEAVSVGAAETLVKIGEPAVKALIAGLTNGAIRKKCINVLNRMGESAVKMAVDQSASWLSNDKIDDKAAVEVLTEIGSPAVDQLISLLKEQRTNEIVRDDNAMFIIKTFNMEKTPNYSDLFQKGMDFLKKGFKLRGLIAGALGEIGASQAVDPLIITLNEEDQFERWIAAGSLFTIGSQRALESLNSNLTDDDLLITGNGGVWVLIGDGKTVRPLIGEFLSGQVETRQQAANILKGLGSKLNGYQ